MGHLKGYVGALAQGDADVRLSERRGIVDPCGE